MDLEVNEETKYFQNGYQERIVVLVKDADNWYIGASFACTSPSRGIGTGFLDGDVFNPPLTITVDQHDETTWKKPSPIGFPIDVNFDEFVTNTVCGEVYSYYHPEAIKAITVSDRMFSWWCVLGHYRDTYGCDIVGGYDVAFDPNRDIYSCPTSVVSAIESALHHYAVSSEGKFFSMGANNYTQFDEPSSGHVVQSGANRLANDGYTWEDILHYYLDYSSYNWPNAGYIQIG